jgi:hypothetical protein
LEEVFNSIGKQEELDDADINDLFEKFGYDQLKMVHDKKSFITEFMASNGIEEFPQYILNDDEFLTWSN